MIIVRLLVPSLLVVQHHQLYSGMGADIVMESIELKMPVLGDELLSGILPRRIQFTPYKTAASSEHLTPR
jgi:hypothetical protein